MLAPSHRSLISAGPNCVHPHPAEPGINQPSRTPSPQKSGSCHALPDGEISPPLKGNPTPWKSRPPLANCAVTPACERSSIAAPPSPLGHGRSLASPTSQLASAPQKNRKQPCQSLLMAEISPLSPRSPLANTKPNTAVILFPPLPVFPALSRVPQKVLPPPETRRAVPDMLFPPPWFPPLHPPFRGAPFQKEHGKGGNPSRRVRRRFTGGTQHGTFSFYVCRHTGIQNHSVAERPPNPPAWGVGQSVNGTLAAHTSADFQGIAFSDLVFIPCSPPPLAPMYDLLKKIYVFRSNQDTLNDPENREKGVRSAHLFIAPLRLSPPGAGTLLLLGARLARGGAPAKEGTGLCPVPPYSARD